MFSRENRRPKRAKFKIYFNFEGYRASGAVLSLGRWSPFVRSEACPLGAAVQLLWRALGLCWLVPSLGRVFRPFWGLSRFACLGLVVNMPLFAILRGFNWVYRLLVWVCTALVLCVACGAFVRVYS